MAEGLNIATQVGEGRATVTHWDEVNATLNNIYQKDLLNQKMLVQRTQEYQVKLADAQKGVRPADQPAIQEAYGKWREASVALQSSKVKGNAQERAKWTEAQQNAYVNVISLADRSKNFVKTTNDLMKQMSAKQGVGYKPMNELEPIFSMRDSLPVDQALAQHYDTGLPYLLPATTFPKQDFDKLIFGGTKPLSRVGKRDIVDAETGEIKGTQKTKEEYYPVWDPANKDSTPWTIANNVASVANQIPSVNAKFKVDYETSMQNNPDGVTQSIADAGRVLGDNFKNMPDGYMKYAIAQHVSQAKPKVSDEGSIQYDKEYERKQTMKNKLLLMRTANQYRRNNIMLTHSLRMTEKSASQQASVDTDLMYKAANNPNKQFEIGKDKDGKPLYSSGFDIVRSYQSAIAADNPNKAQAYVMNSRTLNDPNQRESLLTALFPEAPEMSKRMGELTIGNPQGTQQIIVDAINKKFQQNITVDDINRYAIPIFVKKTLVEDPAKPGTYKPVSTPTFSNPRNRDYGQFHADISQQAAGKKKAFAQNQNDNYMDILLHNMEGGN